MFYRDNFLGRTPMRHTFVSMANSLASQQELIMLSVLQSPQVRPRPAIFHPYKSETKSIPVFFLGSSPPPFPENLPLYPRPCQHLPRRKSSVSQLPTDGNRPMTLIRITAKGSLDSCFENKTAQNLFIIHRAPDSTYGKKIMGIAKTVLCQSSNYSLHSRRRFLGLREKFRGSARNWRLERNGPLLC